MNRETSREWLVTGCSTGFGRSLARHLLDSGRRVVATARKPEQLEQWRDHPNALLLAMDVTDEASVKRCVAAAIERFGRIDVLVNNAGVGYFAAVEESAEKDVRAMFDVNFFGTARTVHALLPHLRERRSGTIVNLTSIGGFIGYPAVGYYCASKFAGRGVVVGERLGRTGGGDRRLRRHGRRCTARLPRIRGAPGGRPRPRGTRHRGGRRRARTAGPAAAGERGGGRSPAAPGRVAPRGHRLGGRRPRRRLPATVKRNLARRTSCNDSTTR